MNPCQWCSELGDRHHLPQFQPSSSTFDFSLSSESQFNLGHEAFLRPIQHHVYACMIIIHIKLASSSPEASHHRRVVLLVVTAI
uniref:Uncharacterized protein n=1 Tax=Oryza glumipatula TaxID=40148 RepID=A0A0E0ATV1_9ORYZ